MKIGPGFACLITGAGSGIGRALALALARKGANITLVDFAQDNALQTIELVKKEYEKLQDESTQSSIFIKCDVTKPADVSSTFNKHLAIFGKLDACINCAGIGERISFVNDDFNTWRKIIDVNLNGVIDCTSHAIKAMRNNPTPGGAIVNVASAGGLFPVPAFPIYSASKGGVVMFTKSLWSLQSEGIRANALCPEFIETAMTIEVPKEILEATGGFIPMEKITIGAMKLIEDETKFGACMWISNKCGTKYWLTSEEIVEKIYLTS